MPVPHDADVGLRGHRIQNAERAEARRRDILLAAARVFARGGAITATLDDVAAAMGVTKGVIYYYFRSKEEIYTEILATTVGESTARLQAIIARNLPPLETLRAAIGDLVAHIFDELDSFAMQRNANIPLSRENRERVRLLQRRYQRLMRSVVQSGIDAGQLRDGDPTLMTFTMIEACLGVPEWYRPGGRLSPHEIAAGVMEQVLHGVVRPEPLRGSEASGQRCPAAGATGDQPPA